MNTAREDSEVMIKREAELEMGAVSKEAVRLNLHNGQVKTVRQGPSLSLSFAKIIMVMSGDHATN